MIIAVAVIVFDDGWHIVQGWGESVGNFAIVIVDSVLVDGGVAAAHFALQAACGGNAVGTVKRFAVGDAQIAGQLSIVKR